LTLIIKTSYPRHLAAFQGEQQDAAATNAVNPENISEDQCRSVFPLKETARQKPHSPVDAPFLSEEVAKFQKNLSYFLIFVPKFKGSKDLGSKEISRDGIKCC
jgi:hypothetical protein